MTEKLPKNTIDITDTIHKVWQGGTLFVLSEHLDSWVEHLITIDVGPNETGRQAYETKFGKSLDRHEYILTYDI